jgi:two-component system, response regulator FlrC
MRLLIVGALKGHISTAGKIALKRGSKVAHANTIDEALNELRSGQGAELLMVDIELDIAKLIKDLRSEHINVPVVACGIGTHSKAPAEAIRAGAKEYLPLPPDPDLIVAVIEAVTREERSLIFNDLSMKPVVAMAEQIAPSEASVLITGKSGTGKEVMARFIHQKSKRAKKPFVSVNCAAIPENLLESELFGHEKGAFTGAVARRIGKFEEANGGTLLLDEISEMAPQLQAKLLRAIQEREIDRVGGTAPVKVDIRLLATSNRDLKEEVTKGTFREDLYFRLNVVAVEIPSLCERSGDIEPLSQYFLEKFSEMNGIPLRPLGVQAKEILKKYDWPGNVRELENTMHRAVLLATGHEVGPEAIVLPTTSQDNSSENSSEGNVGKTVAEVEKELILDTLKHCLGNRNHAANILGISIRTLRNKLKLYGEKENAKGALAPATPYQAAI